MYRINKYVDLLDRFIWTFIQAFIGFALADALFNNLDASWSEKLGVAAIAALLSAGKTVVAQNIGQSPAGDAIPGASTLEPVQPPR